MKIRLVMAIMLLAIVANNIALAEPSPLLEQKPAGYRLEGVGKEFNLKDNAISPDLKITSSEEVQMFIEAITNTVSFYIEPLSSTTKKQAVINIWGLEGFYPDPEKHLTLFRHQDGYFQKDFKIIGKGKYTYTQDISKKHHIYILPQTSTINIWGRDDARDEVVSKRVGIWLDETTCQLTTDITEDIVIQADNITLDGNGHIISGPDYGYGIYLYNRTGVTITNCNVQYFSFGIYLYSCSGNTITTNTVNNNTYYGITFGGDSNNNTLTNNTANGNGYHGIAIGPGSNNNTLTNNTANSNISGGIVLFSNSNNVLINNTVSNNSDGILLASSVNNTLTGNIASNNLNSGIRLSAVVPLPGSSTNTLTNNTANANGYGIYLLSSPNNTIYHNNIYNNTTYNVYSDQSLRLSYYNPVTLRNEGNWWGHTTFPLFIPCVDSNADNVIDIAPYGVKDAWNYVPPIPPLTILLPPTVSTNLATNVTHNSATLNGTVNPNGFDTRAYFEWGETAVYGSSTPSQSIGKGVVNVNVTADLSGLSPNTTYNYRIVASNLAGRAYGMNQAFTTLLPPLPEQVTSPEPIDGAINVIITPILSWAIALGATSYDVYFGTTPALLFVTNTTETNYNPGTLNYNTTYYWRIDSRNAYGTTTGNLWSFTTQSPPVTIPNAPSNLVAVAVSTSEIQVQWTDNSDNETGFELWFSDDGTNFYFVQPLSSNSIDYSHIYSAGRIPHDAERLPGGYTCYYKVRAYNEAGYSDFSNIDHATTSLETPIRLEAKIISDSSIELSWLDVSRLEQGFKIERKTVDGNYVQIAAVPGTTGSFDSISYIDSGLLSGTKYYYRVKAYNQATESAYSNEVTATTFPEVPTIADLIWLLDYYYQNGAIKNQGIYKSLLAKLKAAENSFNRGDYQAGRNQLNAFINELKAQSDKGISRDAASDLIEEVSVTIKYSYPPAAPTELTATALSAEQVLLHWADNSNNEIGFKIEWKEGIDGVYKIIDILGPDVTSYIDITYYPFLHNEKPFYYRIYSFNNIGNSAYSDEVMVIPPRIPPKFPNTSIGGYADNHTPSSFIISWDNAYNEDGYEIERSSDGQTYELIATVGRDVTSYTDTGLLPATTYYYRIKAFNTAGYEYWMMIQGSTLAMPPFSLPQTLHLYLYYVPNEAVIIAPTGEHLVTSLEGGFTLQLSATADPEIASVSIISSSCIGTPITYQGINSGELFFSENPDNPSTGTLNLRTGYLDVIQRVLVNSSYLDEIGIAPLPMEIHHTGTFLPMHPQYVDIETRGEGIIPYSVPLLGGARFTAKNTSDPTKPTKPAEPPPKHTWTIKDIPLIMYDKTVTVTITRNIDCTLTITYTATAISETLPSVINTPLDDPAKGYVTWFQGAITTTQVITNTSVDGKIFIISMAPTITKTGTYTTIQFAKRTVKIDDTILEKDSYDWKLDGPRDKDRDPTYEGSSPVGKAGDGISIDRPGYSISGTNPKPITVTVKYEFRTWVINTGPPLEILGHFYESFEYAIEITSTGAKMKPGSGKVTGPEWHPGPPDPSTPEGQQWKDKLKGYPPPYGEKKEPEKPK